ncbi:MAG: hypothetical protein OXG92_15770 [Chloroflexi bacterium]|nr:hypothetical protein [Chloroflexota bacterium]MCY3582558.1 hypothetical protein [Chloroflexota bacterium]MCY3717906.1 hypothetical protein [Chloroflexota bacterium]MDE2649116.1 hypothetical protein [Chloroflexota bacterium]MXV92721.1 hypothetical protein [Chloroflexota bacterium]
MANPLLLIHPRAIEWSEAARLRLCQVEKSPANPLFREESRAKPPKAWEARLDNVYPNVVYDEDEQLFKCWYKSFIEDEASSSTALADRRAVSYYGGEREEGLLYATSRDGIHWDKPRLGIINFAGSSQNNIVMRRATHGLHAGGVLKDENDPDLARRYKFIHRNPRLGRMASCFSADGLRWSQPQPWPQHDAVGDTHNNALWSPEIDRYVCITRGWSADAFRGVRTVLRSESRDFRHWSQPVEILRGAGAHDQIYSMPIARYQDLYIGLPAIFHKGDENAADWDCVDTELAVSSDTSEWRRICPGEPLIPRGDGAYPDGAADCGCIYAAAPFVHRGEIYIFYGGSNGRHNDWREGSLNLATLPLDRFAGYAPRQDSQTALIRTVPLRMTGRQLRLNAQVSRGGGLRATIINQAGEAVAGLSLDDCPAIRGDGASLPLRWCDKTVASLGAQPFRLLLELRKAVVYSVKGCARASGRE